MKSVSRSLAGFVWTLSDAALPRLPLYYARHRVGDSFSGDTKPAKLCETLTWDSGGLFRIIELIGDFSCFVVITFLPLTLSQAYSAFFESLVLQNNCSL